MPEPYVYANLSNEEVLAHLTTLGACDEATAWVRSHGGDLDTLLAECPYLDWLTWYAQQVLGDRALRRFACDCAAHVLHLFEAAHPEDTRPRDAIEAARRYAHDEVTETELDAAESAAMAAEWAARSAAGAAARAAELAARSAAGAAASSTEWAARFAAGAAARSAAGAAYDSAARAAEWAAGAARAAAGDERAWQRDLLVRYIRGEVPDA